MAKPKRSRDYRAEEARRNAKAKQLGFSSRAQMRRAQRHGYQAPKVKGRIVPTPTARVTPAKLRQFSAKPVRATVKAVAPDLRRLRRESQQWSNAHSRVDTSRYDPKFPASKVRRYHAAFVDPDTRAWKIENGLDALHDYLVDEMGFYDDVEFDERYGVDIAV